MPKNAFSGKKVQHKAAMVLGLVAMMIAILAIVGVVKFVTFVANSANPAPTVTQVVETPGPTQTVETPGPTKTVMVNVIPQACKDALDQADENQGKLITIATAFANAVVSMTQGDYKTAAEYSKVGKKKSDQIKHDVDTYTRLRDRCKD